MLQDLGFPVVIDRENKTIDINGQMITSYKDGVVIPHIGQHFPNYSSWNAFHVEINKLKEEFFLDFDGRHKVLKKCLGLKSIRNRPSLVSNYERMKNVVSDCIKDKNENILPFILYFNKSPKSLKKYLGKGLWKSLCSNKLIENRKIVNLLSGRKNSKEYTLKVIGQLAPLEWDVLKLVRTSYQRDIILAKLKAKGDLPEHFDRWVIFDVMWMKVEMGEIWNENWSAIRWDREHQRCLRVYDHEDLSHIKIDADLKFPKLEKFNNALNFKGVGFSHYIIDTKNLFLNESRDMRHCIKSYLTRSYEGKYLVVHISTDDCESTLGIKILKTTVSQEQHKAYMNKTPSKKNKDAAAVIMKILKDLY